MRALPLLSALTTLSLSSLGGCVIYGKDLVFSDDCGPDGLCDGDDDWDQGDTADGEPGGSADTLVWTFTPNTLAAGETRDLSLTADPVFDYGVIATIELYGDAEVGAVEIGADRIQVVVTANQDAIDGPVDALLLTVDGDGLWLEDALSIGGVGPDHD